MYAIPFAFPSLATIFLVLAGNARKRVLVVVLIAGIFIIINYTSTKHSFFFPIASSGYVTFVPGTWHIQPMDVASVTFEARRKTYAEDKFKYKPKQCDAPSSTGIKYDIGVKYPVIVTKELISGDILPYNETVVKIVNDSGDTGYDVFFYRPAPLNSEMLLTWTEACVRYNKPLVSEWVRALHNWYVHTIIVSYLILILVVFFKLLQSWKLRHLRV